MLIFACLNWFFFICKCLKMKWNRYSFVDFSVNPIWYFFSRSIKKSLIILVEISFVFDHLKSICCSWPNYVSKWSKEKIWRNKIYSVKMMLMFKFISMIKNANKKQLSNMIKKLPFGTKHFFCNSHILDCSFLIDWF